MNNRPIQNSAENLRPRRRQPFSTKRFTEDVSKLQDFKSTNISDKLPKIMYGSVKNIQHKSLEPIHVARGKSRD